MFNAPKTADEVLGQTGSGAAAAGSPMPHMTAYDVLVELNAHLPPKEKITLNVDKLNIDDQKVDLQGTVKTPEELDLLVTELRKVDCFKDVQRGATDPGENGTRRFHITITAQCM